MASVQPTINVTKPQNAQDTWMSRPNIPDCPAGLEYLTQIDQLLVKQKVELAELITGFETNNRYSIKNTQGQLVYTAIEETECCTRQFCGPQRPFTMHVTDNQQQEVIRIIRHYKLNCFGQCFSCTKLCQDEVEVQAPPGIVVGYVKQLYEGCNVRYLIMNESGEAILRLHGPTYFHCHCPGDDYPLQLLSSDGVNQVGKVSKQWSNLMQEFFTDADNFGIQFPIDLDVKAKAVVLGAVFLIDFMFFETEQKDNRYG